MSRGLDNRAQKISISIIFSFLEIAIRPGQKASCILGTICQAQIILRITISDISTSDIPHLKQLHHLPVYLDAGHLGGEGEVSPALTNHKPSFYLLTNHSPCYLDGDPPLLAEAVPLHLDFYQFFCHLGLLLKPEMVG